MLLLDGFRTMAVRDLFAMLLTTIAHVIHHHSMDITFMSAFAQERLSAVRMKCKQNERVGSHQIKKEIKANGTKSSVTTKSMPISTWLISPQIEGHTKAAGGRGECACAVDKAALFLRR